ESVPKADDKTMVRIASESATQKVAADITKNTSKPQEELKIAKDISKADEKADGEILFDDGRKVIIPYGQTIIQSKIYSSNRGIVSVKLPNSVTEVSDSAFEDCRMLTELKLSSNIAKIGRRAFSRCYKLSALYIPESLAKIDECAFSGCSAMRVSISPKNKHYITKNNCLIEKETKTILWGRENSIIPMDGSVKKIGAGAFEACEKLVNVKIPNNITEIGAAAFKACEKLKSVKIPLSVKSIGIFAFLSCPNLTISYSGTEEEWKRLYSAKVNVTCAGKSNNSVNSNESKEEVKPISTNNAKPLPAVEEHTVARSSVEAGSLDGKVVYADGHTEVIPYGTESIADKAYYKKYIESVILPKSVKRIGNDAFGYCYNLKSIDIPEGVTSIGSRAFIWCRYLRNVILPDSLKMLGREVFANCTGLLSIKLSSGLIDIGAYAFNDCNSLASVKIPAGINIIKEGTFEGCKSLAKVELSHKLTEIESKAFSYCDSLASITLPISIKKLGEGVFEESKKVDINYEGTKSLWQTVYHNKVGGEL
ncbi:MAG: leucine-rich repeat domain-containing protein, partial [Clostridia bacterium]|nr:leucine-rich repeat domain-containing protein [Clostridia bacterium]